MSHEPEPAASCDQCGFCWYGPTAADGLRALGSCIRCGGHVTFHSRASRRGPATLEAIDPHARPYNVMGPPRPD